MIREQRKCRCASQMASLICVTALALVQLSAALAQPGQTGAKNLESTDSIRELRFPVAHDHAMSTCFGYLSITPDRITYQVRQPDKDRNHSFDIARSEVKMARPWTVLNQPMNAVEIKFGNVTYHFWLVAAEDVEGGYMSRPPDVRDPIAIIESIHDFDFVVEPVGAR